MLKLHVAIKAYTIRSMLAKSARKAIRLNIKFGMESSLRMHTL